MMYLVSGKYFDLRVFPGWYPGVLLRVWREDGHGVDEVVAGRDVFDGLEAERGRVHAPHLDEAVVSGTDKAFVVQNLDITDGLAQ